MTVEVERISTPGSILASVQFVWKERLVMFFVYYRYVYQFFVYLSMCLLYLFDKQASERIFFL